MHVLLIAGICLSMKFCRDDEKSLAYPGKRPQTVWGSKRILHYSMDDDGHNEYDDDDDDDDNDDDDDDDDDNDDDDDDDDDDEDDDEEGEHDDNENEDKDEDEDEDEDEEARHSLAHGKFHSLAHVHSLAHGGT